MATRIESIEFFHALKDSFYRNSMWIIITSVFSAGIGFIFWLLAAQLYSSEEVGLASALISSSLLIVSIARLGMEQSIVRFFPDGDRSNIFSSALTTIIAAALVTTTVYLLFINDISPELSFNWQSAIIYTALVLMSSLTSVYGVVLISLKRADLYFLQNISTGSRLIFLYIFTALGSLGIMAALGLGMAMAVAISLIIIPGFGIRLSKIDWKFLRESFSFSAGNYISGTLISAPPLLIPIIILNILGTVSTANYYMAYSVATVLFIIPSALGTQLFVEGSHGNSMNVVIKKAVKTSFMILLPCTVAIILFGRQLLALIGEGYAEGGFALLQLFAISSFFVAIVQITFSILSVKKDVKGLILLGTIQFGIVIALVTTFASHFGLDGIGYGWLLAYIISSAICSFLFLRPRGPQSKPQIPDR
jgi:O-antigen/teichoic acid export membrane protein